MTDQHLAPSVPTDALLLTFEQVARLLQVSTATVRRFVRAGELHEVDLGHRNPRIRREELDTFIEARTIRSTTRQTDQRDTAG